MTLISKTKNNDDAIKVIIIAKQTLIDDPPLTARHKIYQYYGNLIKAIKSIEKQVEFPLLK